MHFETQRLQRTQKDMGKRKARRENIMTATISREELKTKIDAHDDFKLVETLPEKSFDNAHLPGAIHVPLDQIAALAPEVLPDKNAEIVVYCASAG